MRGREAREGGEEGGGGRAGGQGRIGGRGAALEASRPPSRAQRRAGGGDLVGVAGARDPRQPQRVVARIAGSRGRGSERPSATPPRRTSSGDSRRRRRGRPWRERPGAWPPRRRPTGPPRRCRAGRSRARAGRRARGPGGGVDVHERDGALVLGDDRRGQLPGDDLAEQAVGIAFGHGRWSLLGRHAGGAAAHAAMRRCRFWPAHARQPALALLSGHANAPGRPPAPRPRLTCPHRSARATGRPAGDTGHVPEVGCMDLGGFQVPLPRAARSQRLLAAAEARSRGRIVDCEDAIQPRGLPARLGALRRRAGHRDPRSPRPRGRMAPRRWSIPRPTTATTACARGPAPRARAWKSVTVVLECCVRSMAASSPPGASRPSTTAASRSSTATSRAWRSSATGASCVPPRSCQTTTRWRGSARVPRCPSERQRLVARRDLAREARLGDLRHQLAELRAAARCPARRPARRRARAAAAARRRGARAPRPAPRARARGASRSPRRPCARAWPAGRRRSAA